MADTPTHPDAAAASDAPGEPPDAGADERSGGLSDLVRRAVSAGVGAAKASKEDILRVAANEMKSWLDRLDLQNDLVQVLSKMTIELRTEIRFRKNDEGKVVPEVVNDVKVK